MQIISVKRFAFLFNTLIDSVYCGIVFMYAQQLDAVHRFMLMCYFYNSPCTEYIFWCLLNKLNSMSTFTIT